VSNAAGSSGWVYRTTSLTVIPAPYLPATSHVRCQPSGHGGGATIRGAEPTIRRAEPTIRGGPTI
jgi:hypothetical protein